MKLLACSAALVALACCTMEAAAALRPPDHETAAMLQLRQALHSTGATAGNAALPGWRPGDVAPHCEWALVECSVIADRQHVTHIVVRDRSPWLSEDINEMPSGLHLPPALAGLGWLESLEVKLIDIPLLGGLPKEWGAAGAFPRLRRLALRTPHLDPPLPAFLPGALPLLEVLRIEEQSPHAELPASWGWAPGVLPALHSLLIQLPGPTQLPAAWAGGFRNLKELTIRASRSQVVEFQKGLFHCPGRSPSNGTALGGGPGLPAAWAAGFPALERLSLTCLAIGGSIPSEWQDGGFPSLTDLELGPLDLRGTLPRQLLRSHPRVTVLQLHGNKFTGSLPDEWGQSALEQLSVSSNALSGPAFPTAWSRPGALPNLSALSLSSNPALHGPLPLQLWPKLARLDMAATGVEGPIPEHWCSTRFAASLEQVWVSQEAAEGYELPDCVERSTHFVLYPVPPLHSRPRADQQLVSSRSDGAGETASSGTAVAACLVAVLALAAVVAASATGWVLRRQPKQRDSEAGKQCMGGSGTMPPQQHGSTTAAGRAELLSRSKQTSWGGGSGRHSGEGSGRGGSLAHMMTVVCAELGSRLGCAIRSLPFRGGSAALAHQLGSASAGLPNEDSAELSGSSGAALQRLERGSLLAGQACSRNEPSFRGT